jgi:hypothetical protein
MNENGNISKETRRQMSRTRAVAAVWMALDAYLELVGQADRDRVNAIFLR